MLVVGYVIMRVATVPLWLRVAREHPAARRTAHAVRSRHHRHPGTLDPPHDSSSATTRSAASCSSRSPCWRWRVPYRAEHAGEGTPWHRHHIAERYELFTIIVLGEVILATTQAISSTWTSTDSIPSW